MDGKTELAAAEADQAVDGVNDLINMVVPIMRKAGREGDPSTAAEMKKKFEADALPAWLEMMENLLIKKGGKHFAGNALTIL